MPAHFGLDFSQSSIKVAQAKNAKDGFELEAFGEIKTPVSFQSSNPQDDTTLANTLKKLLQDSQIKSKTAYISLPETIVYSRVIQMPVLSDAELETALKFEAEQYIPIPLNEVAIQHQILYSPPKTEKGKKMDVLIIAAKKVILDKIIQICEQIEIVPEVVETSLLSVSRSLDSQIGNNALLVDSGDSSTNVAIIQKGIIRQTSSIPTSGRTLTKAIAQGLSLQEHQAKQYKHAYGLEENLLEGKIARALQEPINVILNHIVKNIRFANTLDAANQISQIILSGGTALLPNFSQYLVSKLDLEVNLANPLQNCQNTNLPQQLVGAAPRFSTVIGLAIRN